MFAVYNENTERIEAICPTQEDADFIRIAMEARYYIAYRTFEFIPFEYITMSAEGLE